MMRCCRFGGDAYSLHRLHRLTSSQFIRQQRRGLCHIDRAPSFEIHRQRTELLHAHCDHGTKI